MSRLHAELPARQAPPNWQQPNHKRRGEDPTRIGAMCRAMCRCRRQQMITANVATAAASSGRVRTNKDETNAEANDLPLEKRASSKFGAASSAPRRLARNNTSEYSSPAARFARKVMLLARNAATAIHFAKSRLDSSAVLSGEDDSQATRPSRMMAPITRQTSEAIAAERTGAPNRYSAPSSHTHGD
jgi:hypothetical protein